MAIRSRRNLLQHIRQWKVVPYDDSPMALPMRNVDVTGRYNAKGNERLGAIGGLQVDTMTLNNLDFR